MTNADTPKENRTSTATSTPAGTGGRRFALRRSTASPGGWYEPLRRNPSATRWPSWSRCSPRPATPSARDRTPSPTLPATRRVFIVLVGAIVQSRKGSARQQRTAVMAQALTAPGPRLLPCPGSASGRPSSPSWPHRQGDVRVFVEEGEFVRVLAVCERDGSTLSATIRDAWDGVPLRRRVAKERVVVNTHHVSVMGHITVEELQRAAHRHAGRQRVRQPVRVGARPPLQGTAHRRCVDDAGRAALTAELGRAVTDARKIGRMARTADAEARWAELYHDIAFTIRPVCSARSPPGPRRSSCGSVALRTPRRLEPHRARPPHRRRRRVGLLRRLRRLHLRQRHRRP